MDFHFVTKELNLSQSRYAYFGSRVFRTTRESDKLGKRNLSVKNTSSDLKSDKKEANTMCKYVHVECVVYNIKCFTYNI